MWKGVVERVFQIKSSVKENRCEGTERRSEKGGDEHSVTSHRNLRSLKLVRTWWKGKEQAAFQAATLTPRREALSHFAPLSP